MKRSDKIQQILQNLSNGYQVNIRLGKGYNGSNAQVNIYRIDENGFGVGRFDLHNASSVPAGIEKVYYMDDGYYPKTVTNAENFCKLPLVEFLNSLEKITIQDENYW